MQQYDHSSAEELTHTDFSRWVWRTWRNQHPCKNDKIGRARQMKPGSFLPAPTGWCTGSGLSHPSGPAKQIHPDLFRSLVSFHCHSAMSAWYYRRLASLLLLPIDLICYQINTELTDYNGLADALPLITLS